MDHDDTISVSAEALADQPSDAPKDDHMTGKMIDDRYMIQELLGEGGMGHVYRAIHVLMDKNVAIKLIHQELAHVDEIAKRFEREAKSSSRLAHPNCISVTDFGKTKDNELFLAMELLEGVELDELLQQKGKLEPALAVDIISQVLKGLAHAHEQGVVHRDLKPENIFLVDTGTDERLVKILDFGIAKMASDNGSENLTKTGVVFGTPKYLSPEQALGDKTDHRADLYAAGIILFEMLTGQPPFLADTAMDTMSMHLTAPPPKLSAHGSYPRGLQKIINKAMAKKPEDRYDNAEKMLAALEAVDLNEMTFGAVTINDLVANQEKITKLKESILSKSPKSRVKHALLLLLLLIGATLGVAVAFPGLFGLGPMLREPPKQAVVKQTTVRVAPKDPRQVEIEQLLSQARTFLAQSDPEQAAVVARKALAIDAGFAQAKVVLGHALFDTGKQIGALYQYQHAINEDQTVLEDPKLLENIREGLQWETIRKKSARMLATYGTPDDIAKLADLCNSALSNGDVRRAARDALEKSPNKDLIDWVSSLQADFHELKGCKERNQIISQMVKTGDKAFIPLLEELKPQTRSRRRGPRKTKYACLKASVEYALKTLSAQDDNTRVK